MQKEAFGTERWIYPDPVPIADNMMSWERAVQDIENLAVPKRGALISRYLHLARNHPDPSVQAEAEIALTGTETARLRLAMLGAAMAGDLTVLVKRLGDHIAYAIIKHVWQRPQGLAVSPVSMALAGQFLPRLAMPGSLEMHLAGGDLFLTVADFRTMTMQRPVSHAELERIIRSIIEDSKASQPGMRLTNDELLERLPPHLAGTSKRLLLSKFAELKPKAWKQGGRPRGRAG